MVSYEDPSELVKTFHPAPRKHGVNLPGLPSLAWGPDAAHRAAQRLLRQLDSKAADLGHAGRLEVLTLALTSLDHLPTEHCTPAYVEAFRGVITAARITLEHADLERSRRLQEAEAMRERGRREMARLEKEARRLEGYASKYESVRLSDARYKE